MHDDYQTELNLKGELFKISFLIGTVGGLQNALCFWYRGTQNTDVSFLIGLCNPRLWITSIRTTSHNKSGLGELFEFCIWRILVSE